MSQALHRTWTRDEFFAWAERQEGRFEFDGLEPVPVTGGLVGHGVIMQALHDRLRQALRGGSYRVLGPDVGMATVGDAVRYPDAIVTDAAIDPMARTVSAVVVVFEILSSGTSRTDRIVKTREYAAVPSVRRYVIIESTSVGLTIMERNSSDEAWRVTTLTASDILRLPEINVDIPVADVYADIAFDTPDGA